MTQQILPGFPRTSVLSQKRQHALAAVFETEAYSAQQKGSFPILLVLPENINQDFYYFKNSDTLSKVKHKVSNYYYPSSICSFNSH